MTGIPWDQPGADPIGDVNEWLRIGREHLPGGSLYRAPTSGDVIGAVRTALHRGDIVEFDGLRFTMGEDTEPGDLLVVNPGDGRLVKARS